MACWVGFRQFVIDEARQFRADSSIARRSLIPIFSHRCCFSIPKFTLLPSVLGTRLQVRSSAPSPRSGARGVTGQALVSWLAEARPWPVRSLVLTMMQWLHVVLRRVGPVAWRRLAVPGGEVPDRAAVAPPRADGRGAASCCATKAGGRQVRRLEESGGAEADCDAVAPLRANGCSGRRLDAPLGGARLRCSVFVAAGRWPGGV